MIFVFTTINNANDIVRTKIICHYLLPIARYTHYSEYKHPRIMENINIRPRKLPL